MSIITQDTDPADTASGPSQMTTSFSSNLLNMRKQTSSTDLHTLSS